jgi:glycosyltransferase involved in cell wall biosynthesis
MKHAAVVVAVSEWVRDLLQRNDVAAERIALSRQGTDVVRLTTRPAARRPGGPLRAVMLGRLDGAKGLDLLLEALARIPDVPLELHVYGVEQGTGDAGALRLRALAADDPRVTLLPPFESGDAANIIAGYDVTLVPSQVLETGPLVVLESFAAGVPVVGSRLGGITERVRDGVDGLLITAADRAEWAATLARLVRDPELLPRLAAGIETPRTMRDVAEEMRDVYRRVTSSAPGIAARALQARGHA